MNPSQMPEYPLGWSGWIVPLVLVTVLVLTGKFSPPTDAPLPTTKTPAEGSPAERR